MGRVKTKQAWIICVWVREWLHATTVSLFALGMWTLSYASSHMKLAIGSGINMLVMETWSLFLKSRVNIITLDHYLVLSIPYIIMYIHIFSSINVRYLPNVNFCNVDYLCSASTRAHLLSYSNNEYSHSNHQA